MVGWLVNGAWSQIPRNGSEPNQPTQSKQNKAEAFQPSLLTIQAETCPAKQKQDEYSKPSGYPWGEFLAPANMPNCLLVVVGIWAGVMALKSLLSIEEQAKFMRLQLDQMRRQTDWMLAKERPQLSIQLAPFDPFKDRTGGWYYVRGTVSIRGHADAVILRTAICVSPDRHAIAMPFEDFDRRIQPSDLRLTLDKIGEILPIVPAETPPIPFIAMVYGEDKRAVTDEEIASITRGKTKLYCKAVIEFSDSLGLLPPLCFKQFFEFVCTPISSDDVLRYGRWDQWGECSDNGQDSEYPVS
jgi:hypothetical protein